MLDGVALGLGGHIVGEVVRKTADDGCGGGDIPGRKATDSDHAIHLASIAERTGTRFANQTAYLAIAAVERPSAPGS
jgi:hypothetical protein